MRQLSSTLDCFPFPRLLTQTSEQSLVAIARKQLSHTALLDHAASIEHKYTVIVDNRQQPVGSGDDGCACLFDGRPESGLDSGVGGRVHVGSGFVQDQHAGFPQEAASQTQELAPAPG